MRKLQDVLRKHILREALEPVAVVELVLIARGLQVSEAVRARVLACTDLGTLDRWLLRAATAAADTDVIAA